MIQILRKDDNETRTFAVTHHPGSTAVFSQKDLDSDRWYETRSAILQNVLQTADMFRIGGKTGTARRVVLFRLARQYRQDFDKIEKVYRSSE